jgi:undecaprenyl-diphosphatase
VNFLFVFALFVLFVAVPVSAIALLLFCLDHLPEWSAAIARRAGPVVTPLLGRPSVAAFRERNARGLDYLRRRLDPRGAWGLPMTIAIAVALGGAGLFFGVLEDLLAHDPLVIADVRIHNSLPLLRSPGATRFFIAVTETASFVFLGPLCVAIALFSLRARRVRTSIAVIASFAGAALISVTLKSLVNHPRPMDPLLPAHEASFPSGHTLAAASVYGFLAFLLVRRREESWWRPIQIFFLLVWIVLVALSRIYLGMHWPSDVLGSLAIGLAWLSIVAAAHVFRTPIPAIDDFRWRWPRAAAAAAAGLLLAGLALAARATARAEPVSPAPGPAPREVSAASLARRPPPALRGRSEDLEGREMEPVSLIVIGRDSDLVETFERGGWSVAHRPTPRHVLAEVLAALRAMPDPEAPATPAYYDDRPPTLTFEKADSSSGSIRTRHHTRFWRTALCAAPGCIPVWVATASHDVGIELSPRAHLPTHRIDPSIDGERELVKSDLLRAGARQLATRVEYPPVRGTNAAGDRFVTDGRIEVLAIPR